MIHIQRDVDIQINGLQRHSVPVTTIVQKVGRLLNLPSEGTPPQREDILRWTTHDAAEAHQQYHFEQRPQAESSTSHPTESHRLVLENLCVLAIDPDPQVRTTLAPRTS